MNPFDELLKDASLIESAIGYTFKDRNLMILAFIHCSFVNENRMVTTHNERLEFLGDSILGLIMAEHLYRQLPTTPEGDLSYLRSRLVEASSCVTYVHKLNIGKYVLLGKGERMNDGRGRDSILADFLEALIGAIYLDGGLEAARDFMFRNFSSEIDAILKTPLSNWKALLQDFCQKKFQKPPIYKLIEEIGPDHSKMFRISVSINEQELGSGIGPSKKEAQQAAAAEAFLHLKSE